MAFGTNSAVFGNFIKSLLGNSLAWDLDTDVLKIALYGDTGTPDKDVATDILTGYNGAASAWVVANEKIDTGSSAPAGWPAGGIAVTAPTITQAAGYVKLDDAGANAPSANLVTTLTAVLGALCYDDSLTNKPGMSFHYFGGSQSCTLGSFTVVFHINGIFRITI